MSSEQGDGVWPRGVHPSTPTPLPTYPGGQLQDFPINPAHEESESELILFYPSSGSKNIPTVIEIK